MKKMVILGVLISLFVSLSACSMNEVHSDAVIVKGPVKVMTSIYPLQYFTKRIGGEKVEVDSLLPPGADAHTFEPTADDMITIAESDLFLYNGVGMESYSEKITNALKGEKTMMKEATVGINLISSGHGHEDAHSDDHEDSYEEEHHHGDYDPHVWLDPTRSILMASNVRDALVELRPEEKETFDQNYKELKRELEQLDKEFHAIVEDAEHPEILVSHAAYGYWEDTYGIEQLSISGISPTEEPSQKELKELIETAKKHHIHYVIFEQNVTSRLGKIIQKEMKAEPLTLHNLSVLTDEDIEQDEDYLSLMKQNIETLKQAIH